MKKDFTSKNDSSQIIRGAKVSVRNGDVNGALRTLKKILERDNRQRELAKREYHEKPSIARKRNREMAVKRTRRENTDFATLQRQSNPPGVGWNKSKRKRRRVLDAKTKFNRILNRRNDD